MKRLLILHPGIDVSKNFATPRGLYASMSIWKMGDFFLLQDLCKLALDEVDSTFRKLSLSFFSIMPTTESAKKSAASKVAKLVRAVYRQERDDVRVAFKPTILAFIFCGLKIWEKNKTFNDLLFDEPAFAIDWAATLSNNMTTIRATGSRELCAKCAKQKSLWKWIKGEKVETFCSTCFPSQGLEDWVGGSIESA